jgi:hypothetical protein
LVLQNKTQSLLPQSDNAKASKTTTTISHTFAEHNTIITIYIIGPVSLLFLFRVNRTLHDNKISQYTRKMVLILLLSVQYTTLVVVRYDTIKGAPHYLFTALTFLNLLLYHSIVSNRVAHPLIDYIKPIIGVASVVLMSGFCGLILLFPNIKSNETYWVICCYMEISALLCLGLLDILDIYLLGLSIEH